MPYLLNTNNSAFSNYLAPSDSLLVLATTAVFASRVKTKGLFTATNRLLPYSTATCRPVGCSLVDTNWLSISVHISVHIGHTFHDSEDGVAK